MYRPPSVVELPDDLETLRLALPAIHNVLREIFAHEKTTLEVRRTGCRMYSVRAIRAIPVSERITRLLPCQGGCRALPDATSRSTAIGCSEAKDCVSPIGTRA
jgi:hypothetical protein